MALMKSVLALASTAVLALSVSAQQSGNQQQMKETDMQGMPAMQHGKMQCAQMKEGGMPMNGKMQSCCCPKNMSSLAQSKMQSNEKVRNNLRAAKQSNDPAKMRAALDEADRALGEKHQQMNMCKGRMQSKDMMDGQEQGSGTHHTPHQ